MKRGLVIGILILFTACQEKVVQYPVSYEDDREKFMEFSQDLNKEILREDNEIIENYIAGQATIFTKTTYGFWISNSGIPTEEMAKSGDMIKFQYSVHDFGNNEIYSEDEIGIQTAVLGRTDLPRGLHITLQMIEKGDSAIALLPSFLGYAFYGDKNKIGNNIPLIFKVKVLDIKKNKQ
ncbi:MAG: FKBP-type peptidyl-prolyl cis-trans isomerase [Weeksellaceae bacterium]